MLELEAQSLEGVAVEAMIIEHVVKPFDVDAWGERGAHVQLDNQLAPQVGELWVLALEQPGADGPDEEYEVCCPPGQARFCDADADSRREHAYQITRRGGLVITDVEDSAHGIIVCREQQGSAGYVFDMTMRTAVVNSLFGDAVSAVLVRVDEADDLLSPTLDEVLLDVKEDLSPLEKQQELLSR